MIDVSRFGHHVGVGPRIDKGQDTRKDVPVANVRVRCVSKQACQDPHHGITHLGGENWNWTRQQVVASIEAGTNSFFTLVGGIRANVGVVNGPSGKYVRTYADGKWNDNLLALPECLTA